MQRGSINLALCLIAVPLALVPNEYIALENRTAATTKYLRVTYLCKAYRLQIE